MPGLDPGIHVTAKGVGSREDADGRDKPGHDELGRQEVDRGKLGAMQNTSDNCDVAIIGAGPVGLFAVFECGMLDMGCHVFDALPAPGGQCAALYPEKPIYDIPGYPRIDAAELVERLAEQAAPFAPRIHLGHAVAGLAATRGRFCRREPGRRAHRRPRGADRGRGRRFRAEPAAARRHRGIRGEERLLPGAAAGGFPRPPGGHRRRRRFGGGLGAVAGRHRRAGHRGASPRPVPRRAAIGGALAAARRGGPDRAGDPLSAARARGAGGQLSAVIVADLDGNTRRLDADCLLPFFGLATDLGPLAGWGLDLDRNHIRVDPATCATSRPGSSRSATSPPIPASSS